jgi:hypothetical protein
MMTSQEGIVGKLDQKYSILDSMVNSLKVLKETEEKKEAEEKKVSEPAERKMGFVKSLKEVYSFIERFNGFLKYPLELKHVEKLWHMPFVFDFLLKTK